MKVANSFIEFIDNIVNFVVFILLFIILFISCYGIYDAYATYDGANLDSDIIDLSPDKNEEFSLDKLQKEINEEIVGWIKLDGTNINYPIVRSYDNSVYLNYNYKKEYSTTGSVFLDYRNDDFNDDFSIIYAHNLNANMMFGGLIKYENSKYLEEHKTGTLYTLHGVYSIEVIEFAVLDAYSDIYNLNLLTNGKNSKIINDISLKAKAKTDVILNDGDQLLLLSTCRGLETDNRSVLLTKIVKN